MLKKEKYIFTILTTGLFAFTAFGVQAAEKSNKTKEVTELVGYNVTEKTASENTPSDATFNRIDKDSNQEISLKEFQNASQLENSYAVFINMDTDKNKSLTIDEFFGYNKTKGNTTVPSTLHGKAPVKGTNISSRTYKENNYFVPVDPVIVKSEDIKE